MRLRSFLRLTGMVLAICVCGAIGAEDPRMVGMASSYASSDEGRLTANGEVYLSSQYTACHATFPFGTIVRVTNLRNNKSVRVRINDRFAFKTNRLIDLSSAAAAELELFSNVAPLVSLEIVEYPVEETKSQP